MPQAPPLWLVLRELLADADRYVRFPLFAALAATGIGALLTALAPLALKGMVDAFNDAQGSPAMPRQVLMLAAAYLAVLMAGRLLGEVQPLLMGTAEQRLQARLSCRFFAHVLELPASYHLGRPSGSLSQCLSQATVASLLVLSSLAQILPTAVELVTVVVVLGHLDQPILVAIFICSAIAYAAVFRRGLGQVRRRGKDVSARALAAHTTLADALLNIETIKCFGAAAGARQRYATETDLLQRSWSALHRQRTGLGLTVAAVFAASVGGALFAAMDAVARGSLSIGGFVLATVYMLQMVRPIEHFGAALRDIGQAVEFAQPALDVLRQPTERSAAVRLNPQSATTPSTAAAPVDIDISRLTLAYADGPRVLDELTLHIAAGSSLAIVGASGSGKSSLARLLLGLVEPDAGRILFGHVPSHKLGPEHVRGSIGFVAQDIVLLDDTISANVSIGRPEASPAEIEQACRVACAHDFVSALPAGYDTRVGPRGLKLSGGERQRIGIARALLKRPGCYLFDEATSALDAQTEAQVMQNLKAACAGSTTIFITHRLATARAADRIAVLAQGRVLETGTHTELVKLEGAYARMCRQQEMQTPEAHWSQPARCA